MIKLEVSTHSGDLDIVEVESYDNAKLIQELNNNEVQHVAIGRMIYSRIDVKNVKPVD